MSTMRRILCYTLAWSTEQIVAEFVCRIVEYIKLFLDGISLYQHGSKRIDARWGISLVLLVVAGVIEFIHLYLIHKHSADDLFTKNIAIIKLISAVFPALQICMSSNGLADFESAVKFSVYCFALKWIIYIIYACCSCCGCQSEEKTTPRKRV